MDLQTCQQSYEQMALNPESWISSAKNLLNASDVIWETLNISKTHREGNDVNLPPTEAIYQHADVAQPQYHADPLKIEPNQPFTAIYLMISGFAIENALKAIMATKHPEEVLINKQGTLSLTKLVKTHNLKSLAEKADIKISINEEKLLNRLEGYLTWAGRYPIAAKNENNKKEIVLNIWGNDQKKIKALFEKIIECYRSLTE